MSKYNYRSKRFAECLLERLMEKKSTKWGAEWQRRQINRNVFPAKRCTWYFWFACVNMPSLKYIIFRVWLLPSHETQLSASFTLIGHITNIPFSTKCSSIIHRKRKAKKGRNNNNKEPQLLHSQLTTAIEIDHNSQRQRQRRRQTNVRIKAYAHSFRQNMHSNCTAWACVCVCILNSENSIFNTT